MELTLALIVLDWPKLLLRANLISDIAWAELPMTMLDLVLARALRDDIREL